MENATFINLSQQVVLRERMNLIAQNLANLNTPGFKSHHMIQTSQEMAPKQRDGSIQMPMDYGMFKDFMQGSLQFTGNSLDLAIQGDAFFEVEHANNGNVYYTRAGNFTVNADGEVVSPNGHKLLADGAPIIIPPNVRNISIDSNGIISTDLGQLGQISLMQFENNQTLREYGDTLFEATAEANPAEDVKVVQGAIEGSNVNPIIELTRMIEVSRAYQTTTQTLQSEHERLRNSIAKLGSIRD